MLFLQAYSPRIILDKDGLIVEVNEKFLETTGWKRDCINRVNFFDYLPPSWKRKTAPPERGIVTLQKKGDEVSLSYCCKVASATGGRRRRRTDTSDTGSE